MYRLFNDLHDNTFTFLFTWGTLSPPSVKLINLWTGSNLGGIVTKYRFTSRYNLISKHIPFLSNVNNYEVLRNLWFSFIAMWSYLSQTILKSWLKDDIINKHRILQYVCILFVLSTNFYYQKLSFPFHRHTLRYFAPYNLFIYISKSHYISSKCLVPVFLISHSWLFIGGLVHY